MSKDINPFMTNDMLTYYVFYPLVIYQLPIYDNSNRKDFELGDLPLTQPRGEFLGDAIQILIILDPQHVDVGRLSALPRDGLDLQRIYLLSYSHHIHSYKAVLSNVTSNVFNKLFCKWILVISWMLNLTFQFFAMNPIQIWQFCVD